MENIESLEEFYKRKFGWLPENFKNEVGHFNLFHLEPIEDGKAKPPPYKRRDFYKIILVIGEIEYHYADKVVAVNKQALVFSNPQIPYKCEHLENIKSGYYCIFNKHFFHTGGTPPGGVPQFGNLNKYSVFQPAGFCAVQCW